MRTRENEEETLRARVCSRRNHTEGNCNGRDIRMSAPVGDRVTLEFSCIHSSREQANLARAKAGILLRSEPNNGG